MEIEEISRLEIEINEIKKSIEDGFAAMESRIDDRVYTIEAMERLTKLMEMLPKCTEMLLKLFIESQSKLREILIKVVERQIVKSPVSETLNPPEINQVLNPPEINQDDDEEEEDGEEVLISAQDYEDEDDAEDDYSDDNMEDEDHVSSDFVSAKGKRKTNGDDTITESNAAPAKKVKIENVKVETKKNTGNAAPAKKVKIENVKVETKKNTGFLSMIERLIQRKY